MRAPTYHKQNKFINDILKVFHLRMDEFIYKIVHHHPYEIVLYLWITKLYTRGKSTDEAIQIIYKARNIFLLSNCSKNNS
ncbi:hypothetical protein [Aquimarina aggregata]|uniref:hypothetical protein n=1 Tax=Aquimarina aggregata TaxID=1642818 RepID=UPI00248F565B|nr:hypothetical protein [Aquimarina aggregata]